MMQIESMPQHNSRPKKVLIIVENLPVPNDRRVWLEAVTLRTAGYDVSVISIKGKNARRSYERLDGVNIYRYPAPPGTSGTISFVLEFSYCWIATFLLSLLVAFRHGIDIIHACNPPETFWLLGRFYKLFGVRFVFDHHDLSPEMYYSRFGKEGAAYRGLLALERMTFRTADIVITTNDTHKRIAMERGGLAASDIFVVRSGPDHDKIYPVEPDSSLRNGRRYLVSYLGVLNPQDGVDSFVRIAGQIVHNYERHDIQFMIMGSGDSEEDLRRLCQELGLSDYFTFTGWVDFDQINRCLSTSDICVDTMPKNAYSDAATLNKILEYMAAGRPIVAFDLVESRISAEGAALFVTPDDSRAFAETILQLLDSPAQRSEMGRIGRKRVEDELAWQHQKQHLLEAYEALSSPETAGPSELGS